VLIDLRANVSVDILRVLSRPLFNFRFATDSLLTQEEQSKPTGSRVIRFHR